MRDFFTAYTNTNAVAFPDTEGVNSSGPSETDGTEFVKISIDDGYGWGWIQALFDKAGLTPNGSAESVSNSQVVDAHEILFGIPDGYISGLIPAIAADTDHDITFSVGEARSDLAASLERILLASAITKQIDVNWVAGNNAGGFPSGLTLTADTWYHLFVIKNNSSGVVDAGFDTSLTASNLLSDASGYTEFKRVGSVLTDGSSNILGFTQVGTTIILDAPILDEDNTDPGISAVTATLSVPLGVRVIPLARFSHTTINANQLIIFSALDQTDVAPSSTAAPLADQSGESGAGATETGQLPEIFTDTSQQIRYRQTESNTSAVVRIATYGWKEMEER
ncbi:MAG: hypothetical protein V3V24_09755 [Nitrospinaceae bacterium]